MLIPHISNNKKIALAIVNIFFSIVYASYIYTEWGYDFGDYYATAMHIFNNDFKLYSEAFQSKGPIYFIFIGLISTIIGWGYQQAHIVLSITISFYVYSSWKLTNLVNSKLIHKLFLVFVFTIPLVSLDSNSSIALFSVSLTNLGCYYLFSFLDKLSISSFSKNNILIFNKSIFIFFIAFFTRIDTVIYLLPAFLVYILPIFYKKLPINFLIKNFLAMIIFLSLVACLVFFYMKININDFLYLNFSFNSWYRDYLQDILMGDSAALLYRPNILIFLFKTILFPLFVLIFIYVLFFDKQTLNLSTERHKFYLSIIIFVCAIFVLLYSRSDKGYHALITLTPMILFCSLFFKYLRAFIEKLNKNIGYALFIFVIIINIYAIYPGLMNIKSNISVGFEQPQQFKEANEFIDKFKIRYIVGNNGWISVFAKNFEKKPINSINNAHFYRWDNYFNHEYIRLSHSRLIKDNKEFFLVHKKLADNQINGKNPNFKELINTSSIITSGKYFDVYVITN